jgi:hypothetical protein
MTRSARNASPQLKQKVFSPSSGKASRFTPSPKNTRSFFAGIQTGDHPDASVQGFIVEYRPEGEQQWTVHEGMFNFVFDTANLISHSSFRRHSVQRSQPSVQVNSLDLDTFSTSSCEFFRVQIPKLPTGIAYFVRIKVIGSDGSILVETPEIRARNEVISIRCEQGNCGVGCTN